VKLVAYKFKGGVGAATNIVCSTRKRVRDFMVKDEGTP